MSIFREKACCTMKYRVKTIFEFFFYHAVWYVYLRNLTDTKLYHGLFRLKINTMLLSHEMDKQCAIFNFLNKYFSRLISFFLIQTYRTPFISSPTKVCLKLNKPNSFKTFGQTLENCAKNWCIFANQRMFRLLNYCECSKLWNVFWWLPLVARCLIIMCWPWFRRKSFGSTVPGLKYVFSKSSSSGSWCAL